MGAALAGSNSTGIVVAELASSTCGALVADGLFGLVLKFCCYVGGDAAWFDAASVGVMQFTCSGAVQS
jgi:hypothetical protein